jgi:zinc transport system permease protein
MLHALELDFIQNALLAGLVASVLCGVIGVFVVVKRLAFISGGISHAAFGGLGLCYFLGYDPRLGALAVALLCAVLLGLSGGEAARSHDALIGVFYAVGMALGIVFLHRTPGYVPDLMAYLFGNILLTTRRDALLMAAVAAVVLLLLAVFFKLVVAVSFDETFAFVQGVRVKLVNTLLLAIVAVSVVLLIQTVGIILVMALLTIPPLAALRLARHLAPVLIASVGVGLVMTMGGLAASYQLDLPSGPVIILLGAAMLLAIELARWLFRRRSRPAPPGQPAPSEQPTAS